MSLYSDYYYAASPDVTDFDCIEIEHFRFSPTVHRLVANAQYHQLSTTDSLGNPKMGLIVTHEGGAGPFEYEYVPMKIEMLGTGNDLDQSIRVTLGDVGEIIPEQIDRVMRFNGMQLKPIVRYRAYRSDDFAVPLTTAPQKFEIKRISFNRTGCSFEAIAPYLNSTRTGVIYDPKKFPCMKAFFKN